MSTTAALEEILKLAFKHGEQYWLDAKGTDEEKLRKIVGICRDALHEEKERKAAAPAPKEGRYDIIKGLERAWFDRGHKAPLEAHLSKLDTQYRKDMAQVKVLLDAAKQDLKDNGGCDHSVGMCACDLIGAIEHLEAAFPLPGSSLEASR